jgi:hypothetical protein
MSMWGRFSTKEQDIGALEKVLGRFRTSTSAKREEVAHGNAGRLGFVVVLILVIISLSVWLLRRRTREEPAPAVPVEAEEAAVRVEEAAVRVEEEAVRLEEEAVRLEEEVVVPPPGAPSAEDVAPREDPPPLGEERPRA